MLSSVSYVCLGVCAGMWVITRGIYLGVLCWFCLSSRSCCSSVRVIIVCFLLFSVCVCSFCLYFADVFSSTTWWYLRAAVPQGSSALQSLASSLPDVALASRAPSTSAKYFNWGEDSISPGVSSSQHWMASRLLLIIRWWRVLLPMSSVWWPIKQPRRSLSQSRGTQRQFSEKYLFGRRFEI